MTTPNHLTVDVSPDKITLSKNDKVTAVINSDNYPPKAAIEEEDVAFTWKIMSGDRTQTDTGIIYVQRIGKLLHMHFPAISLDLSAGDFSVEGMISLTFNSTLLNTFMTGKSAMMVTFSNVNHPAGTMGNFSAYILIYSSTGDCAITMVDPKTGMDSAFSYTATIGEFAVLNPFTLTAGPHNLLGNSIVD